MPAAKKIISRKAIVSKPVAQHRQYLAIENVQRPDSDKLRFYLFHAPASEIYQWAYIDRMSPEKPKAIQRRLNRTKVLRIKEFLEYTGNTIATSIVIIFHDNAVNFEEYEVADHAGGFGKLSVTWKPNEPAGIIVDGQHRVIGSHEFEEDVNLNVVGITGADDTEGAFQFLVINNNSSKVSSSQVKALFTSYKEDDLLTRMLDSGSTNVDEEKITALDYFDGGSDSPFKGELKWAKNQSGFIVANALEAGLSEVQNRNTLLSVVDQELDTFAAIWNVIKIDWAHLWNSESHLLEKACVQAVTAYICDSLEKLLIFSDGEVDYSDPDVLAKHVRQVLKKMEPNFFDVQWAMTGLDTRAGQELLLSDLKKMASNIKAGRPWHLALETVNIGAISGNQTKKAARPTKLKKNQM
ncbi:DGQHR domain-containing protein [Burkholderia pyrrocinia]|uniref:DGQHR domain-containing protein n=1 Tax=Burkholderia pyrrocinia TaxID=60550 RepID=UPI0030D39DE5